MFKLLKARLMNEAGDPAGENGGGAGGGEGGGEGGEENLTASALAGGEGGAAGGEGGQSGAAAGDGGSTGKTGEEAPGREGAAGTEQKPVELTPEETKAYEDALVEDPEIVKQGLGIAKEIRSQLPALFKAHNIDPETGNRLANAFAKIEREANAATIKRMKDDIDAKNATMDARNKAYYATYDRDARDEISRAILKVTGGDEKLREELTGSPVVMIPGVLELLRNYGRTLPKDSVRGATAGAGTAKEKGIADMFMGL